MKKEKQPKLIRAILFDLIGLTSYIIPGMGEYFDILWAPLSALLFYKMYGGKVGVFGSIVSFVEEALPFVDFIPTFTIGWFVRKGMNK